MYKRQEEIDNVPSRRNGVLLSIAPTGTTSIAFGNVSSGIEPTFAASVKRRVKGANEEYHEIELLDYAEAVKRNLGHDDIQVCNIARNVSIRGHLLMQAQLQDSIDSMISKTINLPRDISYEDFQNVYQDAYTLGCKSVTTYRPLSLIHI